MQRRGFLTGLGAAAAAGKLTAASTTAGQPPRKVIVGTAMQPFWVPYPGLDKRLDELTAIVDRMARESKSRYGRGLDLAILPEACVTGEVGRDAYSQSVPLDGPLGHTFARVAREHNCYVVVPTYLRDSAKSCSNAAVLLDRKGSVAGTYRKVHLVVAADGKTMEGGSTPGQDVPVIQCDFGKLGLQICYDMEFDHGWHELARKGAEIIAWPTQSPQTVQPAARALAQRCYIASSTWRHNATIFEPTGKVAAQIKPPEQVLVHELDLSYAILPWSSKLKNGRAMKEMFGDRVGFRYYEDEDLGLFWSNDPRMPIGEMARAIGVIEAEDELARVRESYRKAGMANY